MVEVSEDLRLDYLHWGSYMYIHVEQCARSVCFYEFPNHLGNPCIYTERMCTEHSPSFTDGCGTWLCMCVPLLPHLPVINSQLLLHHTLSSTSRGSTLCGWLITVPNANVFITCNSVLCIIAHTPVLYICEILLNLILWFSTQEPIMIQLSQYRYNYGKALRNDEIKWFFSHSYH